MSGSSGEVASGRFGGETLGVALFVFGGDGRDEIEEGIVKVLGVGFVGGVGRRYVRS
jgi:hypothetical protein